MTDMRTSASPRDQATPHRGGLSLRRRRRRPAGHVTPGRRGHAGADPGSARSSVAVVCGHGLRVGRRVALFARSAPTVSGGTNSRSAAARCGAAAPMPPIPAHRRRRRRAVGAPPSESYYFIRATWAVKRRHPVGHYPLRTMSGTSGDGGPGRRTSRPRPRRPAARQKGALLTRPV